MWYMFVSVHFPKTQSEGRNSFYSMPSFGCKKKIGSKKIKGEKNRKETKSKCKKYLAYP